MKNRLAVVLLLSLAGCATAGTAEDFKWTVDCPKSVDRGAEFVFTVKTVRPDGTEVSGARYHYQVLWTAGSGNPLRHGGVSGAAERLHARMVAGPATMVITCENRQGLDVKVAETSFEVK